MRALSAKLGITIAVLLAVLMAPLVSTGHADSLERIWSAANEAYFRGDFETAAKGYEQLEHAGVRDADVSFNLATANARMGKLGHAVLGFSRALWLRPDDEGAEEGLLAAQGELAKHRADREGEAELQTRPPLAEALVRPISADGLAIAMLLSCAAFFACLVAWSRAQRSGQKLAFGVAAPLCFLALGLFSGGLLVKLDLTREGEPVIVLREGAPLREGPDEKALVRKKALEGQAARVLRREGAHSETLLDTGARGWMETKDLGPLRPN